MKRLCLFFCLAALVSISFTVHAQLPSPKEHFGFNIGDDYQLATYTQTEAYFKKLAAVSDRVKLVDIGKTEEGRSQYMFIISSPENLKNLDRYKKISQQLAHAENLTDEQARTLAAEGKAVVWIDGGLHATEVVGAHQLIEIIWQLASRKDAETEKILKDVIVLCAHANPDGQELVSSWYMRESNKEKRTTQNLPRLYEKYAGHDNNRDFYMFNLKETQNLGKQLFVEWLPQIMYNHHQTGPPGSVVAGPPFRDPFNYTFDPLVMTSLDAVGAAMINRLNAEAKPGYTQRAGSVYSTWYNGGLRTSTYFHNMVGLLTEIIGNPTPMDIPVVPDRLIPSSANPYPVLPQKWHFRQSIDYSVALNYGVLMYAMRHKDELLYNIYKMGRNSIDRGEKDTWTLSPKRSAEITKIYQASQATATAGARRPAADVEPAPDAGFGNRNAIPKKVYDSVFKNPSYRDPRGYIIPADQSDFATATRFINTMITSGMIVQKATAAFTVEDKAYPAGSYIIKTNQAFRPHILDMFEPQDHPNDFQYPGGPPVAPYDAAGWTLAYQMGIDFTRVLNSFDGPFERIAYGQLQAPKGTITAAKTINGYVLNASANNSFTITNDLLKAGMEVYRISDSVTDTHFAKGSFYVPSSAKTKATIEKLIADFGVDAVAVSRKPSNISKVSAARIALWDNYGGSMSSGWVRYIFEQYHFTPEIIYAKDIDTGNLKSKYDVIVFVGGAIPALSTGAAGGRGGGGFGFGEPKADSIPEEYRNRLGRVTAAKSIPQLKKFMEEGGNIITIGSSTNLAYHLALPVHNALTEIVNGQEKNIPGEKYYIPGSILQVSVDSTDMAAAGMKSKTDVYFDASPVFNIQPDAQVKGTVKPLAWFSTDQPLRSGWAWGQSYLRDGVVAFKADYGKGKLYAFGPEITFRAQPYGTFKLLFNGLYK
jgi:hypothetical protein